MSDTFVMVIAAVALFALLLIGTGIYLAKRSKSKRIAKKVSADLDKEFNIDENSEFRSIEDQKSNDEPMEPEEVWLGEKVASPDNQEEPEEKQ